MAKRKLKTSRGEKQKRGSVILEILDSCVGDFESIVMMFGNQSEFKQSVLCGVPQAQWHAMQMDIRQRRAIKEMKRKKWLSDRKQGNKMVLTLSRGALASLVKERINKTTRRLPKGEQLLILFDFPVGAGTARSFWRRFLKTNGFVFVQLSVWGTSRDIGRDMAILIALLGAGEWVKTFHARPVKW